MEDIVNGVLKDLSVVLNGKGDVLARIVLPSEFRCVKDPVSRDFRDLLVLRHILEVADFLSYCYVQFYQRKLMKILVCQKFVNRKYRQRLFAVFFISPLQS